MQNIPLAHYSSYRIGGPAKRFFKVDTEADFIDALAEIRGEPFFVLGGGTNVIFSDDGFDGFVLKPGLAAIDIRGEEIHAGAGTLMKDVVASAAEFGLSGLEWAGGLPGTLGGAIRGNAGAFGGEMKDVVGRVRSIDTSSRTFIERGAADCRFSYRASVFKERGGEEAILSAVLSLKKGDKPAIQEAVNAKIRYRNERHPMEYPNAGSVFKNVDARTMKKTDMEPFAHIVKQDPFPVIPTAFLIAEAGLKGVSFGGAMISPKHPNFIVNVLDATSSDVKTLIELVKKTVKEKFGIVLEEEIMYV